MKIEYTPQRADVQYKIVGESIYIKTPQRITKADFSNLEDGKLEEPIPHINSAEKINGELIVTLHQPLDKEGKELPAIGDFSTDEYEEVPVIWKTKEEIEQEENQPSELEQLKRENEMLAMAVMELSTIVLKGDK